MIDGLAEKGKHRHTRVSITATATVCGSPRGPACDRLADVATILPCVYATAAADSSCARQIYSEGKPSLPSTGTTLTPNCLLRMNKLFCHVIIIIHTHIRSVKNPTDLVVVTLINYYSIITYIYELRTRKLVHTS